MAWQAIAGTEYDPDSPLTTGLMGKYVDRDQALYDGNFSVKKAADQTVTASIVLVNDNDFTWAVGANDIWYFHISLIVMTNGGGAVDLRLNWSLPAGATIGCHYVAYEAGALLAAGFTTFAGDLQINYAGNAANDLVTLGGYIDTAAASGTATLQFANWAVVGGFWCRLTAHSVMEAHQQRDTM